MATLPHDEPPFDPYDTPTGAAGVTSAPTDPNHHAEQAVLGAMLADPKRAIPAVTAILRPTDYANPHHETVHDAVIHLHGLDQPVDPLTVAAHLRDLPAGRGRSQLDQIGGALYLHELQQACPNPGAADHYAELVRRGSRRRTLEGTGRRLIQLATAGNSDQLENAYDTAYQALDAAITDYGPAHTPTPTTWTPVDLEPVLAGDYLDPPPTILRRIDGIPLIYAGAVHTVSGESESGKTWLCLLAALQELQAGNNVTFLDFEDRADRVISRLLALGAHPDQIRAHFSYIRPDRPLDDTGRQQLAPAVTGRTLVILDGVTEAMTTHGLDLNSNADSAIFQALLPRWIADHGPAVTLIDHVVKDKEKQDRFALGAQHKLAGIDGAAYIVKALTPFGRGKRGIAQIIVAKDRPGYVRGNAFGKVIAEFALDGSLDDVVVIAELTPPGEKSGRQGPTDTWEPSHLMEKLSRAVQLTPGLSKKALTDMVGGKTDAKRLALELLVARGYIRVEHGKHGAMQHHHIKAYYEAGDLNGDQAQTHLDTTGEDPTP